MAQRAQRAHPDRRGHRRGPDDAPSNYNILYIVSKISAEKMLDSRACGRPRSAHRERALETGLEST